MFRWWTPRRGWSPAAARERILKGTAPARMRVEGNLNLAGALSLRALPERLSATSVNVSRCSNLRTLPGGLECWELIVRDSGVEHLPAPLRVLERIDAQNCRRLRSIGGYQLQELLLGGCRTLEALPEGLRVQRLDVSRCPLWRELPSSLVSTVEYLDVSHCPQLTALPDMFARLEGLNVSDCTNLKALPAGIRVRSWVDVGGSPISELPWSLRNVRVMWHGVPVSERVAFHPHSITVEEILRERNQELRRVLLERVGLEWFFAHARPVVLDEDRDAGGARRLLRITPREGEPIVCVQVQCPSTGNRYLLRVPPDILTCHGAVAWTAGYRNARDYHPLLET
jgi:Domain of unknown function (DUF6745)